MIRIEAPIVANQTLAAASAIFTWAIRQEILTVNPCKLVDRNPTTDRERVLSDAEVSAAVGRLDPALRLILLTGQRPGEVAAMQREHIVDGWWQMPGKPQGDWPGTKNGRDHRVWLSEPAQALVEQPPRRGEQQVGALLRELVAELRSSGHAARPAANLPDVDHPARLRPRRDGPDGQSQDQHVTDVYDRHGYATRTSGSWRRWRGTCWASSRGRGRATWSA